MLIDSYSGKLCPRIPWPSPVICECYKLRASSQLWCVALNLLNHPKADAVGGALEHDQGREMPRHTKITQKNVVANYFADPHSP